MSKSRSEQNTKKKLFIAMSAVLLLLLILFLLFINLEDGNDEKENDEPTLTIETPQKLSSSETKDFTLDVTVSSFGEALYPAASMTISFDPSCLEFLGIEEGNVFVLNNGGDVTKKLPEWSCNSEQCNKSGKINIMYLDTTGGKNAFSKELLSQNDNIVLRLKFRLRGSVRNGDIYDLIFDDAVFAASDEAESLAMTMGSLKVKGCKIVIGE